jgi:hypothetical protein
VYDAAGNVTWQKIGATASTMTYDRNRLIKTRLGRDNAESPLRSVRAVDDN